MNKYFTPYFQIVSIFSSVGDDNNNGDNHVKKKSGNICDVYA